VEALAQLKDLAQHLRKMQESTGNPIHFLDLKTPAQHTSKSLGPMSGLARKQSKKHFLEIAQVWGGRQEDRHDTLFRLPKLDDEQHRAEITNLDGEEHLSEMTYEFLVNLKRSENRDEWVYAHIRFTEAQ
jgi:hypothetical protein